MTAPPTERAQGSARVQVLGVGRALPDRVVTSAEVEERINGRHGGRVIPAGFIRLVSGVDERRYGEADVSSSDLAAEAAGEALADAGLDPAQVDVLIFASASHDVAEPATANLVQAKLKCRNAAVFDVKNACNSFLNAVDIAASMLETGRAERVLVTAGEMLSPTINWDVQNSRDLALKLAAFTLGDAGGACVLGTGTGPGLQPGAFRSDGRHWHLSTVLAGGTLYREDNSRRFFECDSAKLHALAETELPKTILQALDHAGWSLGTVDRVVSHQVSTGLIDQLASLLSYPVSRCEVTVDRFGNTAAASIPLALATARAEGRLTAGQRVLLVGGAAGFSTGVIPITWTH